MTKDADKTLEELEHDIAVWEGAEKDAEAKYDAASKRIGRVYARLHKLRNLRDAKILKDQSEVDWEWFLDQRRETSETYKAAKKAIDEYKLAFSGYYSKTMQKCVQISVGDKDDASVIALKAKGINTLLPFMKSLEDEDLDGLEVVPFEIMEHTLSEFGSYSARYVPNTKEWKILISVYGRVKLLHTSPDLDSFLLYLQNNHPYPKG